ncbi:MAG: hypothetical protein ACKO4K_00730 [Flavobacteriales bacterium]
MKAFYFFFFLSFVGFSQHATSFGFTKIQLGPYLGLQKGRNTVLELGLEKRIKEIALGHRSSYAINLGANFDFQSLLVGLDGGLWFRPHNVGFMWGGQLALRSDFHQSMVGISPTLGYKIWFLHATLGYYVYPKKIPNVVTNHLYASVRLTLTQEKKVKTHERSKTILTRT